MQLSAKGKASLVPIAILINGKFWDASAYKASPVPMALEPGTVYEVEHTGSSQGLFTVNSALHSNAVNVPNLWIGTGSWVPAGNDTGNKTLQAEPVPVGIDNSDAPPRLTKNPQKEAPSARAKPASPPASPTTSRPGSSDEPPRLSKPAAPSSAPSPPPGSAPQNNPNGSSGSGAPSGQTTAGSPAPPSGTKTETKPATPQEPASDSGTDPSHRPRLRRGKPAESFADEQIPGYSTPGAAPSTSAAKTSPTTPPEPVQLIPAISDSDGPDPHSYHFEFLKDEEGERRQQMTAMAKEQVRAWVEARAKARIAPKTTASPASRHLPTKKLPDPILTKVQMTAYDLWSTNQPVLIFSAQAENPPPPAGEPASEDLQYSVLLVAYPDIYNNLHKLYAGVTDRYHLDLTPRLDLIDAVDADGDGRGELLFRETSDAGTGWVIYRATADKLWKMFDSLNPE